MIFGRLLQFFAGTREHESHAAKPAEERYRVVACTNGPPMAEALGYCEPTSYYYERRGKLYKKRDDGTYEELKMYTIDEFLNERR